MEDNSNFSKKILERSHAPVFSITLKESEKMEKNRISFKYKVSLPGHKTLNLIGNSKLTIGTHKVMDLYHQSDLEGPLLGLVDGIVEFLQNRNVTEFPSIQFREVESFLRDSNETPALPKGDINKFVPYFDIVQKLYNYLSGTSPEKLSQKASPILSNDYLPRKGSFYNSKKNGPFVDLPRPEQHKLIYKIFYQLIRPLLLRDQGDVEFIRFNGETIEINYLGACRGCEMSLGTTMEFIQQSLSHELDFPKLLVVVTDS